MPTIGSNGSFGATSNAPLIDSDGRVVFRVANTFGNDPFGIAPRNVLNFGLANGTFDIYPSDPNTVISDGENPLPYWAFEENSNGVAYASAITDAATQTRGITLSLGTAASGSWVSLTTRATFTTDDNLQLRQKAYLTLSKVGTYAGTTQQNLTLKATYYDHTATAISTVTIGTALDNAADTTINGFTSAGGSAISSTAAWVDLEVKITATAAVTSGVAWTLKSLLLATSSATGGSFVVSQAFTSSGTWTAPTGVTSVNIFAVGGGAGGQGGGVNIGGTSFNFGYTGSAGGGAGAAFMARAVPVTAGSSYSIGIGTAGSGGVTGPTTKGSAVSTTWNQSGAAGGAGGDTTFGSLIVAKGGSSSAGGWNRAGNKFAFDSTIYQTPDGGGGGQALSGAVNGTAGTGMTYIGLTSASPIYVDVFPYSAATPGSGSLPGTGSITSTGTATLGSIAGGTAGGAAGFCGSGGGSPGRTAAGSNGVGADGGYGGGGAGAGRLGWTAMGTAQTLTITGPNGGNASANSGAGGGAGGFLVITSANSTAVYNNSTITWTSGAGGAGATGYLVVSWTA